MSEIASRKDGADEGNPRNEGEIPGLPDVGDLELGPVEGDEIDPLPKWWDEPIAEEKPKSANRRIEEGEDPLPPRRKPLRSLEEGAGERSGAESPSAEPARKADPVEAIAEREGATEPAATDKTFFNMTEIEAGGVKVKRSRKSGGAGDGDLSDYFAGEDGENGKDAAAADPDKTIAAEAGAAAAKAGPPPIPVRFDAGLEEKKPLIPDAKKPVKMRPPVSEILPEGPAANTTSDEGPAPAEPASSSSAPSRGEPEPVAEKGPEKGPEKAAKAPPAIPANPAEWPAEETTAEAEEGAGEPAETSGESPAPGPAPVAAAEAVPGEPVSVIGEPLPGKAPAAETTETHAPARRRMGCWTVFATLFFFAVMLVFVVLGAAGFYAWSKAGRFAEEVSALARSRLGEKGIHLDYGSWRYEFPRGIVFDEVTVYDDATKARPAVRATNLGVNPDFLSLARDPGAVESAEFSLRDSTVTLFEKGELFAAIEGVDGEVLADAGAVTVERLAAAVGGLSVRLDGVVRLPDKATSEPAGAGAAEAASPASPFAALDFSGFRALRPWLELGGGGPHPPLLDLSFEMDAGDPELAKIDGSVSGDAVTWRGLAFDSISVAFHVDPQSGELRFPHVSLARGGGAVAAALAVDIAAQSLKIERLQSSVDFVAMLSARDPKWAETFRPVRFLDAPVVAVSGTVPLDEPKNAELEIDYGHRKGLVWTTGERELPLSDLRGRFTYQRGALETNDASAGLFGGQVKLNGAVNLAHEHRPFTGLVEITDLPLDKFDAWLGEDAAGLSGRLFLTFRGTGQDGIASINGGGDLRVTDASLPSFPVTGPVQTLLGKVVPAFAAKSGGVLRGAYILESGILVTNDLTVGNDGARIVASGSVNLAAKETNFTAKAGLEPALAAATGLGDRVIVVEVKGPLSAPDLKLREFPVEYAAAGLGGVLGTSPETLGGLKDLLGTGETAGTITGAIEEATGITLDPAVRELIKSLTGEAPPERPLLRAVPQE